MGTSGLSLQEIPKEEICYFKSIEGYIDDLSKSHKVKLHPQITNIFENKDIRIQLIYYLDSNKMKQKSYGEIGPGIFNSESNTITFQDFFIVDYFFEKEIPLEFLIFGDINSVVNTSLPSIMGARAQTLKKEIPGTEIKLEIKGFSFQSKIYSNLKIDVEINGKLSEKAIKYSFSTFNKDETERKLYLSELRVGQKKQFKISFKQVVIPDFYVCNDGNYENCKIKVELLDCMKEKSLGCHTCNLTELIYNKEKIKFDNYREGIIFIDPIKNYSFLDYLRGGTQICLSIAIDFTASNNPPTDPKSLHYIGVKNNLYEKAIKACGNIVAYYDSTQMFPTYGFGGKFYGRQNVDHCFPLSCDDNHPEIFGVNEVLNKYRQALNNCQLFGPTFFHYFIEKMNNIAQKQVESENYMKYHILMILTDGIIEDTDETIDALVAASFLPISVIIIGIGNADFTNMNILDADEEPLYDNQNRKASRDLVQFVPFKKFQDDPEKLREEVLQEIPRQIVEYYQHKNIPPGEPLINVSTKI